MNPQNERVIIFKCTNTQMFIPKYIMDMMDKIPKHKEEDIIIARIPKNHLKELQKLYPKYVRHHSYTQNYAKQLPNEHSYHMNN